MTGRPMTGMTRQVRELTPAEIEAVSGGVIAIIQPEYKPSGMDRIHSLLPYIEQK
jgi:hypothetical protein